MGCLRLFLALTVCVNHFWGLPYYRHDTYFGVGSPLAVELFFIISGFYMAMILGEKYVGPGMVGKFYQNRVLRLYPTYLVILFGYLTVTALVYLSRGQVLIAPPLEAFRQGNFFFKLHMVVSNLCIVGQDITQFLDFCPDKGSLCLGGAAAQPGWIALLIPQAWTIEVEFMFYLLAPLFVRWRTRRLALLVLAILVVKLYVKTFPVQNDSWYFRVPPLELGLFLLGVLAYRFYRLLKSRGLPRSVQLSGFAAFMACLVFDRHLPGGVLKEAFLYAMAFACIPCAFMAFKGSRLDRVVGELSYPVYLIHQIVIQVVMLLVGTGPAMEVSLVLTLALSFVIHHWLLGPVETFRQRRVRAAAPAGPEVETEAGPPESASEPAS